MAELEEEEEETRTGRGEESQDAMEMEGRKHKTYWIRSAFLVKTLLNPAINGSATLLSTVGDKERSMSRARKVESRSSSTWMTSTTRRRREATTRSLKRLLNELEEARSLERKSKVLGLRCRWRRSLARQKGGR